LRRQPSGQAVIFGGETLVRLAAGRVTRKLRFQAIEEKHLVHAFVLGLDSAARLKFE